MGVVKELLNCRRCACPVVGITCADQLAVESDIRAGCNGSIPLIHWDCVRGALPLNEPGSESLIAACAGNDPAMVTVDAVEFLKLCSDLAQGSMVLLHNGHKLLESIAVVQALANLRDLFKGNQRMAVLFGPSIVVPAEIRGDCILLDESLPELPEVEGIISELVAGAGVPADESAINQAAVALHGLPAFSIEQNAALSLTKSGIDVDACWKAKEKTINQTPGLTFERPKITYADIGGNDAVKDFFRPIFEGSESPDMILQFEELEKMIAGSAGDTSGTSQDQLSVLLDAVESNGWLGSLLLGSAGTGKTYFSAGLAGEYGIPRILFDCGATKGSLVGESEQKIRAALKIVKSVGGRRVLVLATCNGLESVPAPLRRRFNSAGMWFWDLPSSVEKVAIWKVQQAAWDVTKYAVLPDDKGWSAANIRDCCRIAHVRRVTLLQAAEYVVSAISQDPEGIQRLRAMAHGRFLSASNKGAYRMPSNVSVGVAGRQIGGVE